MGSTKGESVRPAATNEGGSGSAGAKHGQHRTVSRADFFREGAAGHYFWYKNFTACMNQRYHGWMAERNRNEDDYWRKAVGALAIAATIIGTASPFIESPRWLFWLIAAIGFVIAVAGMWVAYKLNMYSYKADEIANTEFHRRWTDLRYQIEQLKNDIERSKDSENVAPRLMPRFGDILRHNALLEADSHPYPGENLLMKAYKAENENRHGTGIETDEQVAKKRQERDKNSAAAASPAL